MIRQVCFDFDGTISDTLNVCYEVFRKTLNPYFHRDPTFEEISKWFGLNEEGMMQHLAGDQWQKAFSEFLVNYRNALKERHVMFNGMEDLFRELKSRNMTLTCMSGKGRQSLDITLEEYGIAEYFSSIKHGDPQGNVKASQIKSLLEEYHLSPEEFIYVGDAPSDAKACIEAGVKCCSVSYASSAEPEELNRLNPGMVFDSVEKLRQYLLQQ